MFVAALIAPILASFSPLAFHNIGNNSVDFSVGVGNVVAIQGTDEEKIESISRSIVSEIFSPVFDQS